MPNMPLSQHAVALAAAFCLGVTAAHAEWQYGNDGADGADWAYVQDTTGTAALELYCDDFNWWLTLYAGEDYDDTSSYAATVPLSITVDGWGGYKFLARFAEMDDELVVELSYFEDIRVIDLAYDIVAAVDRVEASFFDHRFVFPAQGASWTLGDFLDRCG